MMDSEAAFLSDHPAQRKPIPRLRYRRFDRMTLFGRRYYFHFIGRNGEIVLPSEGYNSAAARDQTLYMVRDNAGLSQEIFS
jgi:uncharacterized protein YegP (UPF0339 family)